MSRTHGHARRRGRQAAASAAGPASLGGRGRCLATTPIGRRDSVTSSGADLTVPTEAYGGDRGGSGGGIHWIRRTNVKLIRRRGQAVRQTSDRARENGGADDRDVAMPRTVARWRR